jgi:hypothetical protein
MLISGDRSGVRTSKGLLPSPQLQGIHYFLESGVYGEVPVSII